MGYTPARQDWNQIPNEERSYFSSTFSEDSENTKKIFKEQCCVYFPVNRFEEPAWLNLTNLKSKASYTELNKISGYSNRDIICTSPLKKNINWLLDLMFDRQVFDLQTANWPIQDQATGQSISVFQGFKGQSADIYRAVIEVVRLVLNIEGNIRLGAGTRRNRQISVMKNDTVWVPNLFQLSTGEIQLLNLFLSIIRDYDLSDGVFNSLNDVKGIVVIDEIDAHLHAVHQIEVLPKLINSFPNVQFIVTSHAPLFLIGMEKEFGEDGYEIINMPTGVQLSTTDFSELNSAYAAFKETAIHREEIAAEIRQHSKPIVFVEGDYDIRYISKAAELLGKTDLLDRVKLNDGTGFGNLDKVWKSCKNPISEVMASQIILLYDCDIDKADSQNNLVFRRVVPSVDGNPISKGIENLFSEGTITKVENEVPQFIDVNEKSFRRVRGQEVLVPLSKSVNPSEKSNLCSWLCENGTAEDFEGFAEIFRIIETIIGN